MYFVKRSPVAAAWKRSVTSHSTRSNMCGQTAVELVMSDNIVCRNHTSPAARRGRGHRVHSVHRLLMRAVQAAAILALCIRRVGRVVRGWGVQQLRRLVCEEVAVLRQGGAQVRVPVHGRVVRVAHVQVRVAAKEKTTLWGACLSGENLRRHERENPRGEYEENAPILPV